MMSQPMKSPWHAPQTHRYHPQPCLERGWMWSACCWIGECREWWPLSPSTLLGGVLAPHEVGVVLAFIGAWQIPTPPCFLSLSSLLPTYKICPLTFLIFFFFHLRRISLIWNDTFWYQLFRNLPPPCPSPTNCSHVGASTVKIQFLLFHYK